MLIETENNKLRRKVEVELNYGYMQKAVDENGGYELDNVSDEDFSSTDND